MFVDAHFHLGHAPSFHFFDTDVDRYVRWMDLRQIQYCLNIHSIGLVGGELRRSMEENVSAFERSNGRILSYYLYDPLRGEECLKIMDAYPDRSIFKAIKLHPSIHGVYADDPRYEAVWEYARDHSLPIMSHTWTISNYNPTQKYSYPPLFEKYISAYPSVNLICGHSGGRYDGMMQTVKLAQTYPNVYMDVSGDVYAYGLIRYLVEHAGADRVLFGSDGFWIDARTQIGMILGADIALEDKEKILRTNALHIFGLEGRE